MISFNEFAELTSLNEEDLNNDNAEDKVYQTSSSRKQLRNDI